MPQRSRLLTLTAATLAIACSTAWAQDPIFSQYTANAVLSNPGIAGLFEGEARVTASYRDQWSALLGQDALRTYGATAEMRYNVGGRDFLAVSANALRDGNASSLFRYTGAGLGVGMQKFLGGGRGRNANYLGFGARVGFGQHEVAPRALWFSSDIDTTTLVIGADGGNSMIAPGKAFLDVGAGVNYAVVRRDYSFTIGVGGHHLNWPNVNLLFQDNRRLKPRFTTLATAEFLLERGLRLMPSAAVDLQGPSRRITAGSGVYYNSGQRGDAGFRFGTYARVINGTESAAVLEAIIFQVQVEVKRLAVGVSYDVNTSDIGRAVDSRGAYEISLSWTRAKRSRYRVVCPKL